MRPYCCWSAETWMAGHCAVNYILLILSPDKSLDLLEQARQMTDLMPSGTVNRILLIPPLRPFLLSASILEQQKIGFSNLSNKGLIYPHSRTIGREFYGPTVSTWSWLCSMNARVGVLSLFNGVVGLSGQWLLSDNVLRDPEDALRPRKSVLDPVWTRSCSHTSF